MDMGNINDLLSSLSAEDMSSLQSMASSILGGGAQPKENTKQEASKQAAPPPADNPLAGMDPQMLQKMMSIMGRLNTKQDDDTTRFLSALRPLLSEKRRHKADEAMQMMRLFELMPLLTENGLF